MMKFVECPANDQERPFLSDELNGSGQGALQRLRAKLVYGGPDLALGQSSHSPR
jgi:hypothetical protein